jgi:hypothetical protein
LLRRSFSRDFCPCVLVLVRLPREGGVLFKALVKVAFCSKSSSSDYKTALPNSGPSFPRHCRPTS